MKDLIEDFVQQDNWAIVGYSADPSKFGHRIYHDLERARYRVWAVNPRGGRLGQVTVAKTVLDLPEEVEVVDFVIPPDAGLEVARQCAQAGLTRIWLQPGADSPALIELCRYLGLKTVHHHCIMVEKSRRKR